MMDEKFERREYIKDMTVQDARVKFALRSHMYDVSFNYRSGPKNSAERGAATHVPVAIFKPRATSFSAKHLPI